MSNRYRQEVFNVLLAQLLQERGVISAPENIIKSSFNRGRRMPDVIVNFNGLRTALEGEVDDKHNAQEHALNSSRERVEEGIAHIGIAIVYPKSLREIDFSYLKSELANSELDIAIITESKETGFVKGNVDYLESALRHAFEQLVKENVVAQAVDILDEGISKFATVLTAKSGVIERLAQTLGIRELSEKDSELEDESE